MNVYCGVKKQQKNMDVYCGVGRTQRSDHLKADPQAGKFPKTFLCICFKVVLKMLNHSPGEGEGVGDGWVSISSGHRRRWKGVKLGSPPIWGLDRPK